MEARLGGILFTSKFDSGNLARIERVHGDDDDAGNHRIGDFTATPDYEFNLWTKPDCDGTEYQNGNRFVPLLQHFRDCFIQIYLVAFIYLKNFK